MTVINYDFIKSIPNISENNIDDPRIKKIQYANLELIKYKKNTLRNNGFDGKNMELDFKERAG